MIRLADVLAATGGRLAQSGTHDRFADFCFDSRLAKEGQLFVAVVTETGDGHRFIDDAVAAGVAGVLCEREPQELGVGVACVVVCSTQQALMDYARFALRSREIETIGITGGVGKTSTKEAVAAVLATQQPVFRNHASYSGRFGLPIALGSLLPSQRLAVLEMACDSFDEMRELVAIVQPRVGVVTNVTEIHLSAFGDLDRIAGELVRLVEALPPDGIAVLNADDARVREMQGRTAARTLTFGHVPDADLVASEVRVTAQGTTFRARWGDHSHTVRVPYVGAHHAYTAMAALCVGTAYNVPWPEMLGALEGLERLSGRTRPLQGVQGSVLLDDSMGATPACTQAAIETLRALPARRRWVVLGDMDDLGSRSRERHEAVGRQLTRIADRLVTKGDQARWAASSARECEMPADAVHVAYTDEDVLGVLGDELGRGDLVLIKGGAEARLEHVVRELMHAPSTAACSLARQDPGWKQVNLRRPGRPTWLEVNLEAIASNVRRIVATVGPRVRVLAVLKADGYGHGALRVARTALNNGASWLGVACLGEAIALRQSGIEAPILVLGYTPAWQARDAVRFGVTCTVFAERVAVALARAAQDLGRPAAVHVKIDTGMGRLGVLPHEAPELLSAIWDLPGLDIEGMFTHFADADAEDLEYTRWQLSRFREVMAELRGRGQLPRIRHAANSAALFRLPESRLDLVRPGIALYGLNPSPHAPLPEGFSPALTFKCQIAQVKDLPPGSFVSYGRTFCTERASRIAVMPVGYADGFRRAPRGWGHVLVHGHRVPIVGRVCMDQTMVDVTDVPHVAQGDEAVLIGSQGDQEITVDEVAQALGTNGYEVVSEILARVPRVA